MACQKAVKAVFFLCGKLCHPNVCEALQHTAEPLSIKLFLSEEGRPKRRMMGCECENVRETHTCFYVRIELRSFIDNQLLGESLRVVLHKKLRKKHSDTAAKRCTAMFFLKEALI